MSHQNRETLTIPDVRLPATVNYHLLWHCNMKCRFCFATFKDLKKELPRGRLGPKDAKKIIRKIAPYTQRINFAGGEPTLCSDLPELLRFARECGLRTSIVTNGSRLIREPEYLNRFAGILDMIAVSLDSADAKTHEMIGRTVGHCAFNPEQYLSLSQRIREMGYHLKLNTVVEASNAGEDMCWFVRRFAPERWKIFMALPVRGQNSKVDVWAISKTQYEAFVGRHIHLEREGIEVVPEDNNIMTGSYAMISPSGCFFDNSAGQHTYSAPILQVGVQQAWSQVSFSLQKFLSRGGLYE